MAANVGSPNYCWERAGYRIERIKHKPGAPALRNIYDPFGNLVLSGAGYEGEMEKIRRLGLATENELNR
jgi:hypothetical protein